MAWVAPPSARLPSTSVEPTGTLACPLLLDPSCIGSTRQLEFWYGDPAHPAGTGTGLSSALQAMFSP
jgi:hypothetical protein